MLPSQSQLGIDVEERKESFKASSLPGFQRRVKSLLLLQVPPAASRCICRRSNALDEMDLFTDRKRPCDRRFFSLKFARST